MAEDDDVGDEIAMCLSQAQSPKNRCSLLGMDHHLVVMDAHAEKAHSWCACFREVIYHSDNYSLFVQQAPEIELVNHLGDVVAVPPPIVEDTIAGTLEKFGAIEHMIYDSTMRARIYLLAMHRMVAYRRFNRCCLRMIR